VRASQPNGQSITQYLFQPIDNLRRLCDHILSQLVQFFAADRVEFIIALFYFGAELFILHRFCERLAKQRQTVSWHTRRPKHRPSHVVGSE